MKKEFYLFLSLSLVFSMACSKQKDSQENLSPDVLDDSAILERFTGIQLGSSKSDVVSRLKGIGYLVYPTSEGEWRITEKISSNEFPASPTRFRKYVIMLNKKNQVTYGRLYNSDGSLLWKVGEVQLDL